MNKSESHFADTLFVFIIISSCIFLQYHLLVISYGMLFVAIAIIFRLIINQKPLIFDKKFFTITVILCTQQILSAIILGFGKSHLFTNCVYILFCFFISGISKSVDNKSIIIKCVEFISIICTAFVVIQSIKIYVFGKSVDAITILPLQPERALSWNKNATRPCGLFSEPQTYCSYMAPLLIILIFEKKWKSAIFLSIGMVLSGSSLGISITFVIWFFLVISKEMSKGKKLLFIVIGVISVLVFLNLEELIVVRGKVKDIFSGFSTYSSGQMIGEYSYSNYLRIVKGWKTYAEMPFTHKILGIGKDSFGNYLSGSSISFSWNSIWDVNQTKSLYYTSAAGVFIDFGLIGGFLYYYFFIKKAFHSQTVVKRIITILLFESFFTQFSYNGLFVFYVLLIYLFSDVNHPFFLGMNSSRRIKESKRIMGVYEE